MLIPAYIYLSRHNVYYFRWPIPAKLHPTRKVHHIRLSLGTRSPAAALSYARFLTYHAEEVQRRLYRGCMDYKELRKALTDYFSKMLLKRQALMDNKGPLEPNELKGIQDNIKILEASIQSGSNEVHLLEALGMEQPEDRIVKLIQHLGLDVKRGSPEFTTLLNEYKYPALQFLQELLKYNASFAKYELQAPLTWSDKIVQHSLIQSEGKTLKQLVDDFIADRTAEGSWSRRTLDARKAQLFLLQEILGDEKPVQTINADEVQSVKAIIRQLPLHKDKQPKTKGLPIQAAIEVQGVKKITARTMNEYLGTFTALFNWAERNNFVTRNPFAGAKLRQPSRARSTKARQAFSAEEIRTILKQLPKFSQQNTGKSYPYWASMLAVYTGARSNEIAQLNVQDFLKVDGIDCVSFDDKHGSSDKQFKNEASKRTIPLHSQLLELGVLEFVKQQQAKGHTRLFPDLTKSRQGYNREFGRFFNNKFLPSIGLKKPTHVLHSLRHSFVTHLLNANVSNGKVNALTGHADDSVNEQDYNQGYSIPVLKVEIEKLKYEL